ncbi:Serine/threonine-protein kinase PAK 4 [Tupaia chinensis]|uniref:Serine/threonine-protein kinase PAK 4 n=1 Tax=Tupaia chinensis TaxID=246437 RepID=L9KRT9_TUPCH|nr:Serine/threonine-protein kinase PAK 4 [Tupaia chinensis]
MQKMLVVNLGELCSTWTTSLRTVRAPQGSCASPQCTQLGRLVAVKNLRKQQRCELLFSEVVIMRDYQH